ncbi:hypothetical protein ACHHV8_36765 [Paenibacillus sp. TAB 01]|uniref:hypothetical protein n=1 Tax=Paenibacillus sp. TAB 01 TaxID=3368988 RepID=UPI00375334A4
MQITIKSRCWDGARQKELQLAGGSVIGEEVASGSDREKLRRWERGLKSMLGYTVPVVFASSFIPYGNVSAHGLEEPAPAPVMIAAAVPAAVKERILHAFDPLIDLAISLSYPIAGVMIAGGCLFIMIGNRERGMQMLQNSAIGYILVQLSPMFLNLLVGVGQTVS